MLLATTSVLVALASVASQVTAKIGDVKPEVVSPKPFPTRVQADSAFSIKINYPMDTRTDAEKAESPTPIDFTKMSYFRTTGCLLPEGGPGWGFDTPCIAFWDAADPMKNLLDATELRAQVPALSDKLVVGGRYYIWYSSGCTYDEKKFAACDPFVCNPCDGDFIDADLVGAGMSFTTEAFEIVAKGAENGVPVTEEVEPEGAENDVTDVSEVVPKGAENGVPVTEEVVAEGTEDKHTSSTSITSSGDVPDSEKFPSASAAGTIAAVSSIATVVVGAMAIVA